MRIGIGFRDRLRLDFVAPYFCGNRGEIVDGGDDPHFRAAKQGGARRTLP